MRYDTHVMHILGALNLKTGDFGLFAALVAIGFLFPSFTLPEVGNIVAAVTAIFAVTAGFFVVDATENYLALQKTISEENAALIAIAHSLATIPETSASTVRTAIDAYAIEQLDAVELDHANRTRDEFVTLLSTLDALVQLPGTHEERLAHLEEQKDKLIYTNQELMLTAQANLTASHWFVLLLLALLVCVSVLALRDGGVLMALIASAIMVGTAAILMVLRDLDNNRFLERKLGYRNIQRVFESIGLPPYYPPSSPLFLRRPDTAGVYRTRTATGLLETVRALP